MNISRNIELMRSRLATAHETLPGQTILWAVLIAMPLATTLYCLGCGRIKLSCLEALATLAGAAGLGPLPDQLHAAVVLNARLPRTLAALFAGAGLSASGAALQGCFRNPLVGPQTVGVLAGAGFGGSLMLFLSFGAPFVITGAFTAGLVSTLFVVWLARRLGQGSILMMVLSGIVVGALFAAMTTILQYLADPERQLPQLVFWLMGSFSMVNFTKFVWMSWPVIIGMIILAGYGFRLNALSCGEEEARSLGLRVGRDRTVIVLAVSGIAASVVSVAGIVGWVGLVVPHAARMIVGPDHRRLIVGSACIGGALLVAVDTFCRSLTAAELPVGAVTAIVGAPVFLALLSKAGKQGWSHD